MTEPTRDEWVRSDCPSCGKIARRQTYNIGSGPELSCAWCEWCWGAEGQELKPLQLPPRPARWGGELPTETPEAPHDVDDTEVGGAETVGVAVGGPSGPVGDAGGPEDGVRPESVDGVALQGNHADETSDGG